nr:MAG TPA: hypothetical protein [Caudoviricetes sp.]
MTLSLKGDKIRNKDGNRLSLFPIEEIILWKK